MSHNNKSEQGQIVRFTEEELSFAKHDDSRMTMKGCLRHNVLCFLFLSALLGLVYPLVTTGIASVVFPEQASGSLIKGEDGRTIMGSRLIGQDFSQDPRLFESRPSATGYNAAGSGGSNFSAMNPKQQAAIEQRREHILEKFGVSENIPTDMLTASSSGLDPYISLQGAMMQVEYVAKTNALDPEQVRALVTRHSFREFMSEQDLVNVLELNMELLDMLKKGGAGADGAKSAAS